MVEVVLGSLKLDPLELGNDIWRGGHEMISFRT